jgi:hypothetical protein
MSQSTDIAASLFAVPDPCAVPGPWANYSVSSFRSFSRRRQAIIQRRQDIAAELGKRARLYYAPVGNEHYSLRYAPYASWKMSPAQVAGLLYVSIQPP